MKAKPCNILVSLGTALLSISFAHSTDLYWDSNTTTDGAGATPTGTWGADNFWNTDSTGGAGGAFQTTTLGTDDVFFSAGTDAVNPYTISLNSATQSARLVTFEDGTATLDTGTLSLGNLGGITVTTGTVTGATISSNLTISGAQTFNVAASRTLTLDTGTFTRNAGSTLNVLSTGTVTTTMTGLDSASLVNGIIGPWASFGSGASTRYATIDGSNNIIGLIGTAAATAAGVTNTGGTFNYDVAGGNATLGAGANINTLRYTGPGATIGGNLTTKGIMNVSGNALTFSGTVSGGGELVVNTANGNITFSSVLTSGTTALVKDGPGRLGLRNAATTFTGAVTVNGGVLQYGDTISQLTSGNITLNGGVIEQRWNENVVRAQGSGAGQIQILGGESGFSENGATGLNWNIGAITWGSATFNPTKFVLQSAASQNGSSVVMNTASTFNLGGATRTILVNSGAVGNASGTIAGAISNGGLIKEGAGLLNLTATNTYNGGTTISEGTLAFGGIASMPNAGVVAVGNGTTLGINLGGAGNWTTGTSGVGTLGGLLAGVGGAGTSTVSYTGNVGLRLNMGANSTYSGNIGNVGTTLALTKAGGSSLTLQGNNSYTGGTFIQQGTLSANSANALGTTGNITFQGGTLQYTANSAANDYGSRIKNSTSAITLDTNSQNVSLSGMTAGNTGGLTKSGAGILTFTGTNTYSGVTSLNAGTIRVYDGTLTTSGGAVNMVSNTTISVLGGTGVTSTWNLGGQQLGTGNNNYTNVQMVIDGDGVAGSALVTNVGILAWGRTAVNSTLQITDGGRMNVTNEVRIGNPYYNTAGGASMTIGGGTATSSFSGDGGDDFYIGYGERENSNNNVVTVSSGGEITNIRDMFVGHVNNQQGNNLASTANKLTVSGTGTASMRSVSVGYAQQAGAPPTHPVEKANANVVEVTSGGTLTTSGAATNYIGRANAAHTESNANTLTITGTGSTWNAGNQTVYVGWTTTQATATSNNNILTVADGGELTNVSSLIVGFGTGTETGNQLVLNGGSLTATTVTVNASNSLEFGVNGGTLSGSIVNNGALNIGSNVAVSLAGNISGTTGAITQTGSGTTTLSGTNSYTGTTTVNAGTLQFTKMVSLNNDVDSNWTAAKINVKSSATFAVNVDSAGTNGFTDAKLNTLLTNISVANTATEGLQAGAILGFDTSTATGASFTQGNAIADSTGSGAFHGAIGMTKLGAGKLILDKTNTYTGDTTVSSGTLAVNGTMTSNIIVESGAILQGSGSTTGSVTVEGGGTHATGNSIESFAEGTLTLNASSTFDYEIDRSVSATVAGDLTAVTGSLNLDPDTNATTMAILALTDLNTGNSGSWDLSEKLTLISYSGAWDGGLFEYLGNTLTDDSIFTFSGAQWLFNYNDTTAGTNFTGDLTTPNFVTMTVIPETSTALLSGLGALALLRRRRR